MDWTHKNVLITGGTSFIGSHLVEALLKRNCKAIRVVDDLSSGRLSNIKGYVTRGEVEFQQGDLRQQSVAQEAMRNVDVVFHLAAAHGGRGYVDLHQAECATNLTLDGIVFQAARDAGVEKVVYASSGCVYPNYIQADPTQTLYLTEEMVGPPFDADNMYGWVKLMAEMTLRHYAQEWGLKTASCRYFTVYGERGVENHAIIAMIARAFIKQNPFQVWGTGEQVRNWTYVGDIVEGTILAAEQIDDGTAINLGTDERVRVIDAVREILRYTSHDAAVQFCPEMPTGPYNRVASNQLAQRLIGWEPKVKFIDGLHRTIDWYFGSHERDEVQSRLDHQLTNR